MELKLDDNVYINPDILNDIYRGRGIIHHQVFAFIEKRAKKMDILKWFYEATYGR